MKYRGVSYSKRDKRYAPRVWYDNRWVWLRTFRRPEDAARVRDRADLWLHAGNAKLNFKDGLLPDGVAETDVAGWMLEGGVPLRYLIYRIPLRTLIQAGVTENDLVAVGIPLSKVIALSTR